MWRASSARKRSWSGTSAEKPSCSSRASTRRGCSLLQDGNASARPQLITYRAEHEIAKSANPRRDFVNSPWLPWGIVGRYRNGSSQKVWVFMAVQILRRPMVQSRTGLSRSAIYLKIAEGTFPKPISLGARAVGWLDAEVEEWLSDRIKLSRASAVHSLEPEPLQNSEMLLEQTSRPHAGNAAHRRPVTLNRLNKPSRHPSPW
jgi:prophage regulatory protein